MFTVYLFIICNLQNHINKNSRQIIIHEKNVNATFRFHFFRDLVRLT